MAAADDMDKLCCEFFQMSVEKEQAKKLKDSEKKEGKNTTVRKILKDGMGESQTIISNCEASIFPKYMNKTTKKITDVDFVQKVLPDLAAMKTKCKAPTEPKAQEELAKMKKKICTKLDEAKNATTKTSGPAYVDRLTDTSKYTGSHKERFDESGKGKGKDGRENMVDNSGYVGGYKGDGTYGKK